MMLMTSMIQPKPPSDQGGVSRREWWGRHHYLSMGALPRKLINSDYSLIVGTLADIV